jgi:Domain of unknown function (DUF4365)
MDNPTGDALGALTVGGRPLATKKKKKPRDYLERADSSVIDQLARNVFNYFIPEAWVRNDLPNDYGKDYLIDLAERAGPVRKCFFVQLKGTEELTYVDDGKAIAFKMQRRHLMYYLQEVKLPLFLIVVNVKTKQGHWICMQQYLSQILAWKETNTHTVRIPTSNRFPDNDQLSEAVHKSIDCMATAQRRPLTEDVAERIRELQAKDPRIKVQLNFSEFEQHIRLDATEPIPLKIQLRPRQRRRLVRMRTDLFDRGIPVKFDPGEIVIEGSALFSDLVAQGGVFQLRSSAKAQATLTLHNQTGEIVESWVGINGLIAGGQKELHFTSELPRCPFSLKVGPISEAGRGAISLAINPMLWDEQPLMSLAYFDRVRSFFTKLIGNPLVKVRLEIGGSVCLAVETELPGVDRYAPWVDLLEVIYKARVVAQRLHLRPVCSPKYLSGPSALQAIELVYGLLVDKRVELSPTDNLFEIPTPKAELKERTELDSDKEHNLTLADRDTKFQFFGESITFNNVAWRFPSLELYTTKAELSRLAEGPEDEIVVKYRTALGSRPIVCILSDEEMRQLEDRAEELTPQSGEIRASASLQSITVSPTTPS